MHLAWRLAGLSRTTFCLPTEARSAERRDHGRMIELAQERRRFGYRRIHVLLRREGVKTNHKRVHPLPASRASRCAAGARASPLSQPLSLPSRPNEV